MTEEDDARYELIWFARLQRKATNLNHVAEGRKVISTHKASAKWVDFHREPRRVAMARKPSRLLKLWPSR